MIRSNFKFSVNEYDKLSAVTGISSIDLQKIDALGMLNNRIAVKLVLEYEYRYQRKLNHVAPKLIIQAISNKYGLSTDRIRKYLFARERPVYYCSQCQKEISAHEYRKHEGLCEQCVIKNITL